MNIASYFLYYYMSDIVLMDTPVSDPSTLCAEAYIRHIDSSFDKANANFSRLSPEILKMEGMSGTKTRHFYNNLLLFPDARYLEVGVWAGSSTISALYQNSHVKSMVIDDFSEFGGPRDAFIQNVRTFIPEQIPNLQFIEHDCFAIDYTTVGKFNIYLYDGGHEEHEQYDAVCTMLPAMDDIFILIVDDFSWDKCQKGTYRGIKDSGLEVLYQREVLSTDDATGFWNGTGVFLLKKSSL